METKLKFKVGDKVRVKSLEWYNDSKNISGEIIHKEGRNFGVFHPYMHSWCGDVIKINSVKNGYYGANNGWRWYDWMLENEVVTEEKQEVQLQNKNDIETKEMTLQEAQELVKNTKYIVWSEDESKKLQTKLFEIGCEWMDGRKEFYGTGQPFLHVDKHLFITFMRKDSYNNFATNSNRYKRTEDILNIKLEQEQTKTKFDPNTLQPFDKVLVRDSKNEKWRARFFDLYEDGEFGTTCNCYWKNIIPYNEETKHLVGTADEAPDFYRI